MFKKKFDLLLMLISCAFFCITASSLLAQNDSEPDNSKDIGTLLTTLKTDDFSESKICAACHRSLHTETGEDVSHDGH